MATPLETFLRILTTLPIVIAMLGEYRKAVEHFKSYEGYRFGLIHLEASPTIKQDIYECALEWFLFEELYRPQLETLFPTPRKPPSISLLRDFGIEEPLRLRLDERYDIFKDFIGVTEVMLMRLMNELQIVLDDKVRVVPCLRAFMSGF